MKKLITFLMLLLFATQFSFAQDPGFYPPEGSTFNEDSSVVTLPDAYVGEEYNETISFYASDSIEIDVAGTPVILPFVSAIITSVSTPDGLDYSCNIENCVFTANDWGEVTVSGIPTVQGVDSLDINATVTINAGPLGLPIDITFPIPYDGSNAILNAALGDDYSAINSFIPTFILNTTAVGIAELTATPKVLVAPNPAAYQTTFTVTSSSNEAISLQMFDLLGNIVHYKQLEGKVGFEQTFILNTTDLNNGVYIYQVASSTEKVVGRLLINK